MRKFKINTMDINENKIREIVEEIVKKVIREQTSDNVLNMDISKFGEKFLKSIYFDFRTVAYPKSYDDILNPVVVLREVFQDILEPDELVRRIRNRFRLPKECFNKVEAFNKISIYVLYASIGINDKLISDAMEKLGYFVGAVGEEQTPFGMKFRIVQFEPMCYKQKDETDNIKSMYNVLFHWTPSSNVDSIMKNGLIPCNKNIIFNYPPRTYLIKGDSSQQKLLWLGSMLCDAKIGSNDNANYSLLKIDLSKIDDNVRFYLDSNTEIGIYTEDFIEPQAISFVLEKDFLEPFRK